MTVFETQATEEGFDSTLGERFFSPDAMISANEYADAFGEGLPETLDLRNWSAAGDLLELYGQIEPEVNAAIVDEREMIAQLREQVFPRVRNRVNAPPNAGPHRATAAQIARVQDEVLFSGGTEACVGIGVAHETLALTIAQIGVCLVSYHGELGTFVRRLYQRELRQRLPDPTVAAINLLERRQGTGNGIADNHQRADRLSRLTRRGILAYAERAALADSSTAGWRIGRGTPIPLELLTGSGCMELLERGLTIMDRLVLRHKRFVYVQERITERGLLTLGQALRPFEFMIIDRLDDRLRGVIEGYRYDQAAHRNVFDFINEIGPKVVVGVFRVSPTGPPRLFYAHTDFAQEAALVAMADSVNHEHRGFPLLLDLARLMCQQSFGSAELTALADVAYSASGAPWGFGGPVTSQGADA